ncbi:hypothetical protein JTE90_022434 [Oedothorax gibbosus]|uniref:Uncharacterized protein n=1 Tax=Oedothorax gibbosus TaxID=931172 RepID=A0AAV6TSH9_9ARAC|nr:hypothetical protein JTE90_022434 [Oedothorax gibbosus]
MSSSSWGQGGARRRGRVFCMATGGVAIGWRWGSCPRGLFVHEAKGSWGCSGRNQHGDWVQQGPRCMCGDRNTVGLGKAGSGGITREAHLSDAVINFLPLVRVATGGVAKGMVDIVEEKVCGHKPRLPHARTIERVKRVTTIAGGGGGDTKDAAERWRCKNKARQKQITAKAQNRQRKKGQNKEKTQQKQTTRKHVIQPTHDSQKQRAQCLAKPIDQPDCNTERGDVHVHGTHLHSIITVSSKKDAPLDPTLRRVRRDEKITKRHRNNKEGKKKGGHTHKKKQHRTKERQKPRLPHVRSIER